MTHITCRLTAKNRDQLRNRTLGNRVWATFTFFSYLRVEYCDVHACLSVLCVCVFVCLSANTSRPYTSDLHQHLGLMFCACYLYGRGSVFLYRRCDTSCTSGFIDDVVATHNRPYGGISTPLQRVTSLRRSAQANAPTALRYYCSHRYDTIRYDTRCYFNVRSKANMSQFNLSHGCVLDDAWRGG